MLAVGVANAVQGFPALPYVAQELRAVHHLYGGRLLLNEDFKRTRLEQALRQEPFNMVHIASHGQFASDVAQSFILTFDDRLTMQQLDQFLGGVRGRTTPLELLALSACETALGDDRAALGLAGIAIKAGARSAQRRSPDVDAVRGATRAKRISSGRNPSTAAIGSWRSDASILRALAQPNPNRDDQTLILGDVAEKALRQVKGSVKRLLLEHYAEADAERIASKLSTGEWTPDYALDIAGLRGTAQNDILKEFIGRGTWIYPVDPSVKLVADTIEYCAKVAPKYSPMSICGYHIRESGATPASSSSSAANPSSVIFSIPQSV